MGAIKIFFFFFFFLLLLLLLFLLLFKFTKTELLHNFASATSKTLLSFQYISYCKTGPYFAPPNQYPWANRQNTMEDQQTCNLLVAVLFFLGDLSRYCGSFLWKWMKKILFCIHRSFSWRKLIMIRIFFYLILDFNKETHP